MTIARLQRWAALLCLFVAASAVAQEPFTQFSLKQTSSVLHCPPSF